MKIIETAIPGVLVLEPRVMRDERGFFLESYSARVFEELGLHANWVQDNHSRSQKNTLRGLHFQLLQPQAKLCRVARGRVLDVAVDVRVGSLHFGQHVAVELSDENAKMILVPRGFAHGFAVLSDEADFLYKCDDFYSGAADQCGIAFDDPDLGIQWDLQGAPLVSAKDENAPRLKDLGAAQLPFFRSQGLGVRD